VERNVSLNFDLSRFPSPCFAVDETLVEANARILHSVEERTGARVLLAQKGFSMFYFYPMLARYLSGVCASSVDEARLGREEMGHEVHAYAAAWSDDDMRALLPLCDHIVFNSLNQWNRFRPLTREWADRVSYGFRLNPEHREAKVELYDPSAPRSRLGITLDNFRAADLEGISGLHFHNLCEQNSDALERTLAVVEKKFGSWFKGLKWLNFGGGHHVTRGDYDLDRLCRLIETFRDRYGVQIYLEPGEAAALDTGYLIATVLDVIDNGGRVAILDTSATCHMPDVLEMPYRPGIIGSGVPGEKKHDYRLAGLSCLAGDVIGDYSFDEPLTEGDRLVFTDMAHYTMVKTNTFNGIRLPSIAAFRPDTGAVRIIKQFGYEDFKGRLS
jgi:carboxynorspermidine decarboxylase